MDNKKRKTQFQLNKENHSNPKKAPKEALMAPMTPLKASMTPMTLEDAASCGIFKERAIFTNEKHFHQYLMETYHRCQDYHTKSKITTDTKTNNHRYQDSCEVILFVRSRQEEF